MSDSRFANTKFVTDNCPTRDLPTSIFSTEQRRLLGRGSLGARSACKPALIHFLTVLLVIVGNVIRTTLTSLKRDVMTFFVICQKYTCRQIASRTIASRTILRGICQKFLVGIFFELSRVGKLHGSLLDLFCKTNKRVLSGKFN